MKKIFIIGPTASGKTELAKFIFDNFKTEIISVDSAQIYQDMNIGSAKPNSSELNSYPHYLINLIKPTENYSVSQFKKDESKASSNILKNKNVPLLVGGTMLYFNALEYPMDDMPASSEAVRKKVLEELEKFGLQYLYEKLLKIDPECTKIIKPNDKQRVMRALEVYYLSGKPISAFQTKNKTPQSEFDFLKIGLMPQDRGKLHKKIEIRTKEMINEGFLEEVRGLIEKYPELNADHNSMRCVGYRQIFNSVGKKIEINELKEMITIATRQLAKRQLTWMRGMNGLKIFDPFDLNKESEIKQTIESFLRVNP
ncbi:tRNA (adenosine(37)-N6)-dimethylallyltransferase MiaA [Methylophilaceae bacterium]|nr:tRNA (adenosine(37)-N6)-dimethylallyltransferase MiaA [Methylophilaceae bacterium]